MITGNFPTERLKEIETPFYYYDMQVLRDTLAEMQKQLCECFTARGQRALIHYAVKACATPSILRETASTGIGADCVSGGEIEAALKAGFKANDIVFAGVAKSDKEIRYALQAGIFCFNVESLPEIDVINEIAREQGKRAQICLRINPNVDAHTHAKITTGMEENKFGIQLSETITAMLYCQKKSNTDIIGLHFHIGSQITDMQVFANLSERINQLQADIKGLGIKISHINVGGGLGILYEHPNHFPIPDFKAYFNTYREHLKLEPGQTLHFELGRSITAQCGNLMTRCLYVKQGVKKQFAIVDAGMTDLIRPALYGAFHRIENLSNPDGEEETYDIVGPICESSDVFAQNYSISTVRRGDLLVVRSAGAYGEVMASRYNLRQLPQAVLSTDIQRTE